jgi:hypothetical protein
MASLLGIAFGLFAVMMLIAFLIGRLFADQRIRKRIMIVAGALCGLAFGGYFGFIAFVMSGDINR